MNTFLHLQKVSKTESRGSLVFDLYVMLEIPLLERIERRGVKEQGCARNGRAPKGRKSRQYNHMFYND